MHLCYISHLNFYSFQVVSENSSITTKERFLYRLPRSGPSAAARLVAADERLQTPALKCNVRFAFLPSAFYYNITLVHIMEQFEDKRQCSVHFL